MEFIKITEVTKEENKMSANKTYTKAEVMKKLRDGIWECEYDLKSGYNEIRICGTKKRIIIHVA